MNNQLTLFDRDSDYLESSVKDFDSKTASFRVHASLIYKLGESLIADEITALSELIKNAYDADATVCALSISSDYIEEIDGKECTGCIELSDNGCGMDLTTIVNGWLTLSNSPKKKMKKEQKTTPKYHRYPLGDKGLGRLSVQKIGRYMQMTTKAADSNIEYCVIIPWGDFLKNTTIDQIPVTIEKQDVVSQKSYTKIIIKDLINPEMWGQTEQISLLTNSINKIVSPFRSKKSSFHVVAQINGQPIDTENKVFDELLSSARAKHTIKYSTGTATIVDDCFFARKREDIEATIYSEMCTSLEPFRAILSSCNQTEIVDAIDEMMTVGADSTTLIQTLLDNLEEVDLLKCFDICEKNRATYAEERDIILAFLEGLKSEGQIIEYRTFSSTTEANLFDIKEAGMTEGAILWLLDRNFSRVGESEEAGLKFAENILKRENASQNYIYILSAVEPATGLTEDGIEEEFDKVLAANCLPDTHSFIYFISKRRLQTKDNTKIARSLSQGFKRKACFELFQLFNSCLCDGVSTASSKVQRIRQKTLNYLFANKASVRGESYIEVAARLVQIFHQDEYNKAIAGQHSLIAEKAHYYEKLCAAITETVGNEQALTSTLKEYRDIELYNKHINAQHCEIATGDIFKIGSSYFLLVSQACDTCLRSDGHRKLEFASLLEIQDNKQTKFSYPLSCFLDMQKPVVMYHALKIIPFDILDLCVFNGSGQASVVLNDIASYDRDLEAYTNNYRIRFGEVLETVKAVQSNRAKLESFLSGGADITAEDAKAAYEYLEGVDSNMKKFDSIEIAISFPVRRIARLNELTTIDIVKEYGIALSRIGHPFDFSGEISAFE